MSKAGKKILRAAREAVDVAKGKLPAARITIRGHTYVPLAEYNRLRAALDRYGLHEPECPINDEPWSKKPCNCGFARFQQTTVGEREEMSSRPSQELEADNRALRDAILAYLSEFDNPVPDALHRKVLRDHLRKLVGAPNPQERN